MTDSPSTSDGSTPKTDDLDYDEADLESSGYARYVAGLTDPLLDALGVVRPHDTVVDLGSGAGEPALTLAARRPDLTVLGVDTSPAQIAQARLAADRAGCANARFEQRDMSDVGLPDGSVGGITSRMAALQFADAQRAAHEIARLLRPGAAVSLGLWGTIDEHPAMRAMTAGFVAALGAEAAPDLAGMGAFTDDDSVREGWLRVAGLTSVHTTRVCWTVRYGRFGSWFGLVETAARMIPGGVYESLDDAGRTRMREEVRLLAEPFRRPDGSYEVEICARILTGRR